MYFVHRITKIPHFSHEKIKLFTQACIAVLGNMFALEWSAQSLTSASAKFVALSAIDKLI